jgi:Zn-dependent peptidase ImmA (M78 family)
MSWSASFGDPTKFKISFEVMGDPDVVGRQSPYEASWGRFEIWVDGINLCSHIEQGEAMDGVHWYLWPLFNWIAEQWDPLLHEEQMALRELKHTPGEIDSAALFLNTTSAPPPWYQGQEIDKWERTWSSWWFRHNIAAAREGGLFPSVTMRRYRDQIEISWDAAVVAGAPESFRFLNSGGVRRFESEVVALALYDALNTFASRFATEFGKRPEVKRLVQLARQISAPEALGRRIPWLIGLGRSYTDMKRRTSTLLGRVPRLSMAMPTASIAGGIITPSTRSVALMYGSVSPDIDMDDAVALAEVIVKNRRSADHSLIDTVADELGDVPVSSSMPWESGYALSDAVRQRFVDSLIEEPLDVEALVGRLGVRLEQTHLHDPDVRGVSVAGEGSFPVIVINESSGFNQSTGGRRFTIAHELCHLLVDRVRGGDLGIVSGIWAPREIERRANAFSAMLLMPIRALEALLPKGPLNYKGLCEIAAFFQTTPLATSSHLVNLGLISRSNFENLISYQP